MNTPAHGIELPRFAPAQKEPFTVAGFVAEVQSLAAYLRERTTPRPTGGQMRAPVSTDEDPEFESGTRLTPAGRAAAARAADASMEAEDTLVSSA